MYEWYRESGGCMNGKGEGGGCMNGKGEGCGCMDGKAQIILTCKKGYMNQKYKKK